MNKISNPAFDYDKDGQYYSQVRKEDPRIFNYIKEALGDSKTVLNVGAGAGSYEPQDRYLVAVEPSAEMRSQRIKKGKVPAVCANSYSLPFDDKSFDASIAIATIHHWQDLEKGLTELRRVTKNQVVILGFDPESKNQFWNEEYFPELIEVENQRDPKISLIKSILGGRTEVRDVIVPCDCTDGFQEAFFARPEAFLQKEVRMSQSAWGFLSEETENRLVRKLEEDLKSGEWDRKYNYYREMKEFRGSIKVIVNYPE